MSRLDQNITTEIVWDDKIGDILENPGVVKEEKVVIADFDSLIHTAAYSGKGEDGTRNPEYTEDQFEIAEGVLADNILKILLHVEEYFIVSHLYICIKGKGNFRKKLYSEYKSKRAPCPPIINHLCKFLIEKYDAIPAENCEADDCIFSISQTINHSGIILSVDHDMDQIPDCIIYNYNKNIWKKTTKKSARQAFAMSMLTGCSGDSIPGVRNIGPKKAEKIVRPGMTDREYTAAIWKAYKECYKEQAKEKITMMYNLLKLHNINELPKI